jgi:hypothetical protein
MPKKDRTASGAAIASSGGVLGAVGLAGGGVPGVKAKKTLIDVKGASGRRKKAAEFSRAYRGGEFEYRRNAHHTHKVFDLGGPREGNTMNAHFRHGQNAGAIKAEDRILSHLKFARRGSNLAMLGGAGAVAYGVHRAKTPGKVNKSQKDTEAYHGALLGAGGSAAGASVVGSRVLERQGRKWAQRAASEYEGAHKIMPRAGGASVNTDSRFLPKKHNPRVPDIKPEFTDKKIGNEAKKTMAGKSRAQAHAAGELRGAAAKSRYFAGTYGQMAGIARRVRNPALAVAGVGAGGLLLSRKKPSVKKSFNPRMSAFGIEH